MLVKKDPCYEEFQFLAESLPQLVWTKNPQGDQEFLNKRWEEYTGLVVEGKWDWTSMLHPEDYETTITAWNESLKTGNFFEIETRIKRSDGMYRWHLVRAIPVHEDEGNILSWIGTCTDIHENRSYEDTLKKKNMELQKINKDLDNFIYTASHDFKGPVSNMEALVTTLKEEIYDNLEQDHKIILDLIDNSIAKFKETIAELTEISKTYKNINEDIEHTSFLEVFNEIKMEVGSKIKDSGALITLDFHCPYVIFSHKYLKTILGNLLSNSLKYRSFERELEIQISTYEQDKCVVLCVKDNGLGMDPAKKDKAFSMFRRLHTHVEGTGIGLYIVKSIIENSEGKIEMESEVGKGTIVKVYFKIKKN